MRLKDVLVKRNYKIDFRADGEDGVIEGRPIVYNSVTDIGFFDEVIEKGALDNCDLDDVLFFTNHNMEKIPLARSRRNNGNSTMKLTIDDNGLYFRAQLDIDNNAEARALYSSIKRGDIDGMSFGFIIKDGGEIWENTDSSHPLRKITAIEKVIEISAVNFPAYEDTSISARDKLALDNAKKTLDNVLKKALEEDKKLIELEKAKNLNRIKHI